uniref:Putative sulfurtransferase [tusA, sirA, yhhP] n=1 Tax=Magnetococcus massalia (strain MO-1) TaxID=451514 RepID=A0A1S7LFA1_MAGMO|nr:Putative sulfurtransferase [tusA, sirA, yhhP] [Candidatus Magnetococcus massalia]
MEITIDQSLDARGMNCPLPILKTKKLLGGMRSGQILEVIATDPGSVKDMDSFCQQTGNKLVAVEENSGTFHFNIRKS